MPVIDGAEATRLIRRFEEEQDHPASQKPPVGRKIPIIAVSASLKEDSLDEYGSCSLLPLYHKLYQK
jgi:CheY-like chemotaxis protein